MTQPNLLPDKLYRVPDRSLKTGKRRSKLKQFCKEYWYLLLCMAIPALLMYCIYAARLIHPIGDGSVLVLDLNGQYVWFFEALRNFARGDASLLYSFARAMGGEFLGIYAYYIASPLSFIVCLFPANRMLEGLLTLFLIKTALCGGTFGYYMHKTSKNPRPVAIVVFSILYALSAYGIVQQHNTMWIDAMMWLPLITLGIESLIRYGKFKLYTILLAVTLFSNFYIGYMVCFYCLFYFFFYYFGHSENRENNPLSERAHLLKSLVRMAFYSLLAVGIAFVILISAYYSLSFGKTTFSTTKWQWNLNFDLLDLIYKFLPASYDTVRPDGYPFVYCGVLTLLLLPAYFLSKKFPMRQKICAVLFILIFIFSFSLSVPDLIWHGFQRPNWLNYRYSFMLCFFMCVLACRALSEFESIPLKTVAGTGGLIALLCVFLQKYTDDAYIKPNDFTCIWFTLICIFAYLAVLGLLRTEKKKAVVCVGLVTVICAETFLCGLWHMNALDDDVVYSRYSYYNDFMAETRPIIEEVQASDSSFYRMEKTNFRKLNDNMALNVRGLSGSTSTLNQETIMFLAKMGYASQSHWSKYLGGTPLNDSLMGIKYIISDRDFEEYDSYYERYRTHGKYIAYQNPYALSIAYGVDEDLLEFPLGYREAEAPNDKTTGNKDQKESKIGAFVAKLKNRINKILGISETVRQATYEDPYYSPFERLNAIVTAMTGADQTVQVFVPVEIADTTVVGMPRPYSAENHACYNLGTSYTGGSITFTLQAPSTGELYFYLPTNYPREVSLSLYNETQNISSDCGSFGSGESLRIVSLGLQNEGDLLTLTVRPKAQDLYYVADQPCIYMIDQPVFESVMAELGRDQLVVEEYTEDSFFGSFTATKATHQLVMTTLAYDEGWQITVDGQKVSPVKALGSTVAFYVDGELGQTHRIELVYRPKTLVLGLTVSLASIGLFILLAAGEPLMRRIPVLRSVVGIPRRRLRADTRKKHEKKESASKQNEE